MYKTVNRIKKVKKFKVMHQEYHKREEFPDMIELTTKEIEEIASILRCPVEFVPPSVPLSYLISPEETKFITAVKEVVAKS